MLCECPKKLVTAAERLPASDDESPKRGPKGFFGVSKGEQALKEVKKTLGSTFLYMYYEYLESFHLRPATIEDMFEGMCFLRAQHKIKEIMSKE